MAGNVDQSGTPAIDLGTRSELAVARHRVAAGELHIARETVNLELQVTADRAAMEGSQTFTVPPANTETVISVRSYVSSAALQQFRSAAAVAVQRRREVAQIGRLIRSLPDHADRTDFHSFAYPAFDLVRRVHHELLRFDRYEGNTCMILRYVRNSLLDGGWNHYRDRKVADAVAGLLDRISKLEAVGRQDAKDAFRLFYELNLKASLPVVIESGNESDG